MTIVVLAALIVLKLGLAWYFLLFLISASSASGFIQARMHFCANFGMRHMFNFTDTVGRVETVVARELWSADRRKALQIIGYAILCGLVVTGASLVLRYILVF